ncbi:2-hydroxyacid dehydrogenase [Ancylobacter defluvii]|uniref:Glyoxylate/hydroxypyruvate reductase A n=1 Tax=Ancylobacter defluvii TaxID=1282440 RepID=A0A9W6JYM9_9HYPH|nr:glyoxylate/hydroxypyruvate reductase A [Ancylobacter defluvii]MBS7588518.1 glyoxylate/hydroxypyruvate reductase A [Ancylobacter defluvii]GLK83798.1 glyoxylate/hydroxypyruvate reductase A [Ancylobacter defluvii]
MNRDARALLIAATGEDPEPYREALKAHMPDLVVHDESESYDPASIAYALVWKPTAGLMARLPNLEAIFSMGAGIDHVLADPELPPGPPIVRLMHDKTREQMRDYALHAVLHYYRLMDVASAQQASRKWAFLQIRDKAKLKVGVLGLGEMGGAAARALAGLGFSVLGWSRSARQIDGVTSFSGADGLKAMLAESYFLLSVLPATEDTVGILNAELFAALPKGAVVINIGRGNHLVPADLLAALDSGHLAGAALDVFDPEPMPQDSPFWTHPKVRVTPHIASDGNAEICGDAVTANIRRIETGLPPEPVGDRARGY